MTSNEPLEGKVAQILNEREIAITIGANDGVKRGMKFAVLAEAQIEIRNPDTGELLGVEARDKVRVQTTAVYERWSRCSTYIKRTIGGNSLMSIGAMFREPREEVQTLRTSDDSYLPPLDPDDSFVKIGDTVRQITEE